MSEGRKKFLRRAWDFCRNEHHWDDQCHSCDMLADAFEQVEAEASQHRETALEQEREKLLDAYYQDQGVTPEGELRPLVSKLLKRVEVLQGAELNMRYGHAPDCLFGMKNSGMCDCGKGFKARSETGTQFCKYCGAGIGKYRRVGEGTCPKCARVCPNCNGSCLGPMDPWKRQLPCSNCNGTGKVDL